MQNPYTPSTASPNARPPHTTTRGQIFVPRAIGIPLGGVAICLIAEFVADYLDIYGFRGNNLVTTKLLRVLGANLFFAIPYFVLSSPLMLLKTTDTRRSIGYPMLGGAVGVLVPRIMIGYGWEVQTNVGLDSTTLFFFAAGCGAAAGGLAEASARMVTAGFRSTTPSAPYGG